MAIINLAEKYSEKVQERFSQESLTDASFSKALDMEFIGAKSVKVYDIGTAAVNDYSRTGASRYGSPEDLDDHIQEFTMSQDKSSTWTIDKGNQKEQLNVKQAGQTLQRQLREQYTPMIDRYRFARWADGAGTVQSSANAPTKSTIVSLMLDLNAAFDNAGVPESGRMFYVPITYYKALLLSDEFTKADPVLVKALGKGVVGELFGVPVKKVPTGYLPSGVYFMEIFKGSAISPVKLKDYRINNAPQGISGDLVEMRVMYDAFVIGSRAAGVGLCCAAASAVAAPTVSWSSHVATISCSTASASVYYTDDGSDPRYSDSAKLYDSSAKPTYTAGGTVLRTAAKKSGMFQSAVTVSTDS